MNLFNEYRSSFFTNSERDKEAEKNYINTMEQLKDISDKQEEENEDLKFTILSHTKEPIANIYGVKDSNNVQFIISSIDINNNLDKYIVTKKLLNGIITNLEIKYPNIDIIFWNLTKTEPEMLEAALDLHFTIEDTTANSFKLFYHLVNRATSPSSSSNTSQISKVTRNG